MEYLLTDAQWARLSPLLPGWEGTGTKGGRGQDNRRFVEAVRGLARNGCRWRALPAAWANWPTTYTRFQRWTAAGVWARVLAAGQQAYLLADRGYNSDPLVTTLAARGTCALIPPRRERRHPRTYDAHRYAQRHPVERLVSPLRQFRRGATRYDKLATHFLAFGQLAATVRWLRDC